MSGERKGGPHKKERKTLKYDADIHAALLKYAQSKKIPMNVIASEFILKGIEYDIFDPNWIEKLEKADSILNRYANLDDACPAMSGGQKNSGDFLYRCIWFRPDSPPKIKNLGDTEELQGSACLACGGTRPYVEGMEERDVRIRELEIELGSKSSERFKIPKCNRGAVLHHDKEDQLIFTNCFRHRGEPVSVKNFCRIQSNGLPCSFFAELVVGVEGKKNG